jgi:hypothetical protein
LGDKPAEGRNWRLTELIGDYARLDGGEGPGRVGYGRVTDAVLSRGGEILAVIVHPDIRYGADGPYAWPFYGVDYGFDPGAPSYDLPAGMTEVRKLQLFDYSRHDIRYSHRPVTMPPSN